jgi:hypothetical protein
MSEAAYFLRDANEGQIGRPWSIPEQSRRAPMRFERNYGTYSAVDARGRRWLITARRSGWRLEFLDPGDQAPTYAGTHATMRDAECEAST